MAGIALFIGGAYATVWGGIIGTGVTGLGALIGSPIPAHFIYGLATVVGAAWLVDLAYLKVVRPNGWYDGEAFLFMGLSVLGWGCLVGAGVTMFWRNLPLLLDLGMLGFLKVLKMSPTAWSMVKQELSDSPALAAELHAHTQ